jgi:hypothetical protein
LHGGAARGERPQTLLRGAIVVAQAQHSADQTRIKQTNKRSAPMVMQHSAPTRQDGGIVNRGKRLIEGNAFSLRAAQK